MLAAERAADGLLPPATLVRDAQKRGVEVRPTPDVNLSLVASAVEDGAAVQLGLAGVTAVGEEHARRSSPSGTTRRPFTSLPELVRHRAPERALESLVVGSACECFGVSRRTLLWELGLVPRSESVPGSGGEERQLALPLGRYRRHPGLREQTPWEVMLADYRATRISDRTAPAHAPAPTPLAARALERPGSGRHRTGAA